MRLAAIAASRPNACRVRWRSASAESSSGEGNARAVIALVRHRPTAGSATASCSIVSASLRERRNQRRARPAPTLGEAAGLGRCRSRAVPATGRLAAPRCGCRRRVARRPARTRRRAVLERRRRAEDGAEGGQRALTRRPDHLVRDLVRRLRGEPQRQGDYGESIGVLARTSAEVGTEAANLLREFNASLVRPALPIRLVVNVKMPTPVMVDRAVFTGIVALPGRCPALCAHTADAREGRAQRRVRSLGVRRRHS